MYEHHRTFVAEHEGKVVGIVSGALKCVWVRGEPLKVGYFFDMRVAPQARRQGVASALYSHVESAMREDGAAGAYLIVMTANTAVRPLTQRIGLEQIALVETLAVPVQRRGPVHAEVKALRSPAAIAEHVNPHFAGHDLFVPGWE
jgi:ribosomal protein S18 acetylase RimI-like enzyme